MRKQGKQRRERKRNKKHCILRCPCSDPKTKQLTLRSSSIRHSAQLSWKIAHGCYASRSFKSVKLSLHACRTFSQRPTSRKHVRSKDSPSSESTVAKLRQTRKARSSSTGNAISSLPKNLV